MKTLGKIALFIVMYFGILVVVNTILWGTGLAGILLAIPMLIWVYLIGIAVVTRLVMKKIFKANG